ncbi:MAG: hypothetical protein LUD68_05515 [Rikenellaceae bacterium]|nr:hypothetical protein [Rikenellaceae bacterium]
MRWCIIKYRLYLTLFFFGAVPLSAAVPPEYGKPLSEEEEAATRQARFERNTDRYMEFWNGLIPRYGKVQFAGGMGLFSLGIGWDYGRSSQWETDLFLGYLPKFSGDKASLTFTLKQNYIPWDCTLGGRWHLEPLTTGLYINKLTSRNFWGREPEKYGSSYYRFSTNTRASIFLGQRLTYLLHEGYPRRSLTFFYEFSTCDLYLITCMTNRAIDLTDILVLSFGVKFQFL